MLPNFICPGAARSATTTLYYLLIQHPRVFLPQIKETRFFALDYDKGLDWYEQKYYAGAEGFTAVGDISPVYLIHDECPGRVHESLGGEIKLLFMLRDPVERAYSHYRMLCGHRFEDLPFEQAIALDEERRLAKSLQFYHHEYGFQYLKESTYTPLIQRYLRYFPRENMKFVLFEEFAADTPGRLRDVLHFLGVSEPHQFDYSVYRNEGVAATTGGISRVFYCNPLAQKTRDFIQRHTGWRIQSFLKKTKNLLLKKKGNINTSMNADTEKRLRDYFAGDIEELEKVIGRDLSGWRG